MLLINTRRDISTTRRNFGAYKFQGNEPMGGGGRNMFGGGFSGVSAIPSGSLAPQSWIMPQKPGNMASQTDSFLVISKLDMTLIPAYNLLFSSSSSISITNAQLDQIVAMLVNAGMTLTKVQAILSGAANGTMNASGSITVTNAQCGAIIDFLASGSCSITPNMFLTALANMQCDIGGATPLSPEGLAFEMFDNQDIETGYSLRESLKLMLSAMAGKLSGAGTTTVTIRDINDLKDRITAIVDSNGNRTSVTKDVT